MTQRILRRKEVERLTGRSRTAIYLEIRTGAFPSPVRLGPRAVGWYERDIQEWIESREPVWPEEAKENRQEVSR